MRLSKASPGGGGGGIPSRKARCPPIALFARTSWEAIRRQHILTLICVHESAELHHFYKGPV
jgi:hypothetical protein